MYYWLWMIIAIITEVIGTLAMKYSIEGTPILGHIIMYCMLIISYSSLAIAIKKIPLVVAYGIWESLGLILIAFFSFILFSESLSVLKITGIIIIIIGIICLEFGIKSTSQQNT